MAQTLHIAVFNTDIPVPNVSTGRASSYGQIFHDLLTKAATRSFPGISVRSTEYDSRHGEYPDSLDDVDVILITGSINSAYDEIPWIHRLEQYIIDVYRDHPRVKWFGSCFGHQLICQALLKQYGVRVDADERGYEVGVKDVTMSSKFRCDFAECPSRSGREGFEVSERMRLQFVHGDFVVIPHLEKLPSSWSVIGSTPWCANQVSEPLRLPLLCDVLMTSRACTSLDGFSHSKGILSLTGSSTARPSRRFLRGRRQNG